MEGPELMGQPRQVAVVGLEAVVGVTDLGRLAVVGLAGIMAAAAGQAGR